jgi:hypothetical protein
MEMRKYVNEGKNALRKCREDSKKIEGSKWKEGKYIVYINLEGTRSYERVQTYSKEQVQLIRKKRNRCSW